MTHNLPDYPLVTFVLLSFNQETFIEQAVAAALEQTYPNLEIIFSDDASSDQTFSLMKQVVENYKGNHEVHLNCNSTNMGLADHLNKLSGLTRGEFIVLAAGDDVSLPHRTEDSTRLLLENPDVSMVSFVDDFIDENGETYYNQEKSGAENRIRLDTFLNEGVFAQRHFRLSGASRTYRRSVFDVFGNLAPDCPAEDGPYLMRSLYLGDVIVCERPGIQYRIHKSQMSSEKSISQMNALLFKRQYLADIDELKKVAPLPVSVNRRIRKFISDQEVWFNQRRMMQTGVRPSFKFVLKVLGSGVFTVREKLGVLRRMLTKGKDNG